MSEKEKTVFEGEREIPVYTECDLLVVGGGAAGHSAAVAAARAGCKNIVLMERYGYMGGDVTGGYVIMVPRLSFYNKQYVRGLQEEWFTRMESIPGAVLGPSGDEIGCEDPVLVNAWKNIHDCFSTNAKLPERLVRSVYFEPNIACLRKHIHRHNLPLSNPLTEPLSLVETYQVFLVATIYSIAGSTIVSTSDGSFRELVIVELFPL